MSGHDARAVVAERLAALEAKVAAAVVRSRASRKLGPTRSCT